MNTLNIKSNKSKKRKSRTSIFITMVLVILFFLMVSAINNMSAYGDGEQQFTYLIIQTGDTLWDIASEYSPKGMDIRETIMLIKEENNLVSDHLVSGDFLKVPVNY